MTPVLALQKALVARLGAVPALAGCPVFDRVPDGREPPFVQISDMQAVDDGAECLDHVEVFATLQIWSRAVGRVELRTLSGHVRDALHQWQPDLAADGCEAIEVMVTSVRDFLENDGLTSRAVITVRALIASE